MESWHHGLNIEVYRCDVETYEWIESEFQRHCYFAAASMLLACSPNIVARIHELEGEMKAAYEAHDREALRAVLEKIRENWKRLFARFNALYEQRRTRDTRRASIAVRFFPKDKPGEFHTVHVLEENKDVLAIVRRFDLTEAEMRECVRERQPEEWAFWTPRPEEWAVTTAAEAMDQAVIDYLKGPPPSASIKVGGYTYVDEDGDGSVTVPSDDELFGEEDSAVGKVDKSGANPQNSRALTAQPSDLSDGTTPSDDDIF